MTTNRRTFIKTTVAATAVTAVLPLMSSATTSAILAKTKKIRLKDNAVILFQGDSITDAGRDRDNLNYNDLGALAGGYVGLTAAQLLYDNPGKNLKIYNKGISGNKVFQLADRWEKDSMDIKPDVLSIMVGVNDFWHTLTNGYKGTITTYKDDYAKLISRTKDKFPDMQLIIAEPFGIKGVKAVDDKWYPAFVDYQHAAREIADRFDAVFIPLQSIFDDALKAMAPAFWTRDGVHPTMAGTKIMSKAWLDILK